LIQKGKASDSLYETIREKIMNYNLKPGHRLIERDLAKELGTSRTPIREVIHKLEKEGLVVVEANKGAYVAPFSAMDMAEIYQIRMVIEAFAGRLVTPDVTEETLQLLERINSEMIAAFEQGNFKLADEKNNELHRELYKNCHNKRLYEMIIDYWAYAKRLRSAILTVHGRMQEIYEEHLEIIQALRMRNPEEVERLIRYHLERALELFHKAIEQDLIIL